MNEIGRILSIRKVKEFFSKIERDWKNSFKRIKWIEIVLLIERFLLVERFLLIERILVIERIFTSLAGWGWTIADNKANLSPARLRCCWNLAELGNIGLLLCQSHIELRLRLKLSWGWDEVESKLSWNWAELGLSLVNVELRKKLSFHRIRIMVLIIFRSTHIAEQHWF